MKRQAILIFADSVGVDLLRRRLPKILQPLFRLPSLQNREGGIDVHLFTSDKRARTIESNIHSQRGVNFAERLENAAEEMAALGYEDLVLIGRDCPQLNTSDIATAFERLAVKRLVLGPDHRGGCYLIALHACDRHLLHGIRWKQNTDCAQLRDRCADNAVALLAIKQDLDSWSDLRIFARTASGRLGRLVRSVVLLANSLGEKHADVFVDLAHRHARALRQMPPPLVA